MKLQVKVLVEHLSDALLRARTFPPFKLDLVGHSWAELEKRLTKKLNQRVAKTSPRKWIIGSQSVSVERFQFELEVPPPRNGVAWSRPIPLKLDAFRFPLDDEMMSVLIPAVGISVVASRNELSWEMLQHQTIAAFEREMVTQDLGKWVQRFHLRRFAIRTIDLVVGSTETARDATDPAKKFLRKTRSLRSLAANLSKTGTGSNVFCRDEQADSLGKLLFDEPRRSVLLVGPPGVGKSAIVQRLAYLRKESGHDRIIWSTTGSRIISGMSGMGMWQQRMQRVIREIRDTNGVLHLGSLKELVEAGKVQGQPGVASMVRQALAAHRFQAIAEITPEQIAQIEQDDPMLIRAFVRLEIQEPKAEQVESILHSASKSITPPPKPRKSKNKKNLPDAYEESKLPPIFTDKAISELYQLHRRFASNSALPAAALRLMRSIIDDAPSGATIDESQVIQAFSQQTGLPLFLLDDALLMDANLIREQLESNVMGQPNPVDLVVNLLATFKMRLARADRPLASMLFIGPTGVGKTEMAKAIAKTMYSDPTRMIRIDMSEFSSPWSTIRLIGRPGEGDGVLTSPIREQPFSVVLLDEFEKADPAVFDLLLQLLGEGRLTDAMGRTADFRNAIVIMTSNLGVESFRPDSFGFGDANPVRYREHFEREVRKFVRPEFLGRIDRVVPFMPLGTDIVRQIVEREIVAVRHRSGLKSHGIDLQVTPQAIDRLAQIGYVPRYGARPIRRAIEEHIVFALANKLEYEEVSKISRVSVDCQDTQIVMSLEKIPDSDERDTLVQASLLDEYRELRRKAKLTRNSSVVRHLENEIERQRRHQEQLQVGIAKAHQDRRRQILRKHLAIVEQELSILSDRHRRMLTAVEAVFESQHELAMRWYRGEAIDDKDYRAGLALQEEQLRESLLELAGESARRTRDLSLVFFGRDLTAAKMLWSAYADLAKRMRWSLEAAILMPYAPKYDPNSAEYRKREQRKLTPQKPPFGLGDPLIRLLSPPDPQGAREKWIDLYRVDMSSLEAMLPPNAAGIVLHFQGEGVGNWLSDEEGVHHFILSNKTGAQKRERIRICPVNGMIVAWEVPPNWDQIPSLPDRDPRRVYHLDSQTITDPNSPVPWRWENGMEHVALAELITENRERALWQSIGYDRTPDRAGYGWKKEDPFLET